MPRIRTIKPEFFTSLTIASLPFETRLTFIGLWTHADDEGRCVDDTRLVRAALWALDDRSFGDVDKDLQLLADASLILRYTVGGKRFLVVNGWKEHQRINRPTKSKIPAPPGPEKQPPTSQDAGLSEGSLSPHAHLTEDSRQERKGKEQGTGKGTVGPSSALGSVRAIDAIPEEAPPSNAPPTAVERIMAQYRDNSPRGISSKLASKLAEEAHTLLADGFDEPTIGHALVQLRIRKLGPGCLAAVVDELANTPAAASNVVAIRGGQFDARPSTTDQRVAAGLALAARLEAEETQGAAS